MIMENYEKGEVKELGEPPKLSPVEGTVCMRVAYGSKIKNLMGFALKKIKQEDTKHISWNGCGHAITKTVSCGEIMKRKVKGLHQITQVYFTRFEEYWEPKTEGLERLQVNRDVPAITVLLSKEAVNTSHPGYQAPGMSEPFHHDRRKPETKVKKQSAPYPGDSDQHKSRKRKKPKAIPEESEKNPTSQPNPRGARGRRNDQRNRKQNQGQTHGGYPRPKDALPQKPESSTQHRDTNECVQTPGSNPSGRGQHRHRDPAPKS